MSDTEPWDFLGIAGAFLCVKCGHPFEAGDRVVLLCGGEKVKETLNPDVLKDFNDAIQSGDVESFRPTRTERMAVFNLVHEHCEP